MQAFITSASTKQDLLQIWNDNTADLVDAFIAAGVDPDDESATAEEIYLVIQQWINDGDECATC